MILNSIISIWNQENTIRSIKSKWERDYIGVAENLSEFSKDIHNLLRRISARATITPATPPAITIFPRQFRWRQHYQQSTKELNRAESQIHGTFELLDTPTDSSGHYRNISGINHVVLNLIQMATKLLTKSQCSLLISCISAGLPGGIISMGLFSLSLYNFGILSEVLSPLSR
jgi:hypothetical protein